MVVIILVSPIKNHPNLFLSILIATEMNYDILFDKRLNKNHLQSEVDQIPPTILSALSAFNEAVILLDTKLIVAFVNEKANEMLKIISGYCFEPGENILNLLHNEQQVDLKNHLDHALAGNDVQYEL